MNPLLKKVVATVAVKEAIEKVQEMRRPKPSLWSRISPFAIVAAIGGAAFYLNKSGKLAPLLGGAKDKAGSGSSNGTSSWESNGSTPPAPSNSAPSPSTV